MTQISASAFSSSAPLTFAQGRNGDLYAVNGLGRGLRWDTVTAQVEQLGITAPAGKPALSASLSSPKYFIQGVDVLDGGFCYQAVPEVSFSGGGGSGAAAKAELQNGRVHRILMQDYGTGYTSAPTASVPEPDGSSPAGTGATFSVATTGKIAEVLITATGSGYTSPPAITVTGGGGSGAVLTAELDDSGSVVGVVILNPGSGYTSSPTITFASGAATATATILYSVTSVSVSTAGSGYSGKPRLLFSGDGGGAFAECTVGTGATSGQITAVTVLAGGAYRSAPTATVNVPAGLLPRRAKLSVIARPAIQGKYWAAIRYVDDTADSPIPSSITQLAEIEITSPAGSINWSWSNAGMEDRVSRIELWRTSADQALVLYRVAVLPKTDTSFTDTFGDSELIDPERPADVTGTASTDTLSCTDHGLINGSAVKFLSLTGGAGLTQQTTYYVINATTDTFQVSESVGGAAVNFTTNITAGKVTTGRFGALPIVLPNGQPNARRFQPPPTDKSAVVMFQDRAWYGVDTSGSEPNSLYFSEVDEPESVPDTNELVIQTNVRGSDAVTALMPFGSALMVMQNRHIYRLSYAAQPVIDASVLLVAQRGCLNQRCWDAHDGVAYVADSIGMYAFDGNNVTPISDAVETFWTEGTIHFASSKWFFVRVDPATRIVRFFHSVSQGMPDRALCFHPVTKAWWIETYAQTIAAGDTVKSGGRQRAVVGGQSGSLYFLDSGSQDVASNGSAAGIACSIRTGNLPFDANDKSRSIRLLYSPTSGDCTLALALHYNNSSTPRNAAVSTDRGTGFTTTGGASATLNMKLARSPLGDSTGYAVCSYSGRLDDRSSGGDRHLSIALSVTRPAAESVVVHGIAIDGVAQ